MKKVVCFGEIMLRLAAPGHLRFRQTREYSATFGGGEANVALSLANFGIPVSFVTRLPHNDIADGCLAELRGFGVDTSHVVRGGERMGIYFLETGAVSRPGKVIYDRSHSAIAGIEPGTIDWEEVLQGADWFHWTGITPAISNGAAGACLEAVDTANKMGLTVSCDLNYRKNLWNYGRQASDVMPELVSKCDLVLGNEEDAEKIFGIKPDGFDATSTGGNIETGIFTNVCKQLQDMFPRAKHIVLTLRGAVNANHNTWGGIIYDGAATCSSKRYDITHIVDRVGGGDSFMAGIIYGMLNYAGDLQRVIEFAAAASALKHTIYGDYNMVSVEEVERLTAGDGSGRVIR